jgi:hypothetical protein
MFDNLLKKNIFIEIQAKLCQVFLSRDIVLFLPKQDESVIFFEFLQK